MQADAVWVGDVILNLQNLPDYIRNDASMVLRVLFSAFLTYWVGKNCSNQEKCYYDSLHSVKDT